MFLYLPDLSAQTLLHCADDKGPLERYVPLAQTILTVIQVALVTWLTWYTFERSSRERKEERRAAFFHALILDGGLRTLRETFERIGSRLEAAANELDAHRAHWLVPRIDAFISETMADYSVNLSASMRAFALRVHVMDAELAKQLSNHGDTLEDRVADWFQTAANRQGYDSCASLKDIIVEGENEIYRLLHDYEFKRN